jgi:hypothetical protein
MLPGQFSRQEDLHSVVVLQELGVVVLVANRDLTFAPEANAASRDWRAGRKRGLAFECVNTYAVRDVVNL